MVIKSRFSNSVPSCSIQTWIFGSPSGPLSRAKAFVDAEDPDVRFLTFAGARLLAKRIAVGLIEGGLQPGDRVLIFSGNSIFYPVVLMGIWMAGGIFTGANPGYVARELACQLKDSGACIMLAQEDNLEVALRAAEMAGMKTSTVYMMDNAMPDSAQPQRSPGRGTRRWTELIASRKKGELFEWIEPVDPRNTTCSLNYSSGTTGMPKGVEVTHYNHIANGLGIVTFKKLHPDFEARRRRAAALCFLPMYHAYCQGYFVCTLPHLLVPIFVMPRFDVAKMLAHMQTFRITMLFAVPPVLALMSRHPLAQSADLSAVDIIGSGAAPLPPSTLREISQLLPSRESRLRQGYGMTELTCTAMSWDPRQPASTAIGELMPDCQARLMDINTGEEVTTANRRGELWIAAPTLMRGYWRNREATDEAIVTDSAGTRWMRTGDVAYVETYAPGAHFHIVDRIKELIKVKGYQVAPAELDALLLQRTDIADAAVVGVTIGEEERPRAYIVRAPGSTTSEGEIAAWLAERVVKYKRLTGGVVLTDMIPRNTAGKISRKTLRERAQKEVEARAKL